MPLSHLAIAAGAVHVTWSLQADSERSWQHLTDTAALPTWLGTAHDVDARLGGRIVVDHGGGYLCDSTIKTLEPGSRLVASWKFPDEPESLLSLLLTVADDPGQTALVLSHSGLADLTASYAPGWLTHLTYFEGSLAGNPLPMEEFWRIYQTLAHLHAHDDLAHTLQ